MCIPYVSDNNSHYLRLHFSYLGRCETSVSEEMAYQACLSDSWFVLRSLRRLAQLLYILQKLGRTFRCETYAFLQQSTFIKNYEDNEINKRKGGQKI